MTLLLMVGVLFGATNTDVGREQVRVFAERQINGLLQGARVSIEELDGNLLRGARVSEVVLADSAGREMLRVERIGVDYRLLPLLWSRADVSLLTVDGVEVDAAQRPDSLWDWATLLPPSEEESAWNVAIDSMSLSRASARVRFLSDADSTLRILNLKVRLQDMQAPAGGDVVLTSGTLASAFQLPMLQDTVHVDIGGGFVDGVVSLDTLALTSARSQMRGNGRFDLAALPSFSITRHASVSLDDLSTDPGERGASEVANEFRIEAAPLALADIAVFIPGLRAEPVVTGRMEATQMSEETAARLEFALDDGGTVSGHGTWREEASRTRLAAGMRWQELDPGHVWEAGMDMTPISGALALDLSGASTDSLSGTINASLNPMMAGPNTLAASRLDINVDAGSFTGLAETVINGSSLTMEASGRWLDSTPKGALEARVDEFDVGSVIPDGGITSDLTMTLSAAWTGLAVETMAGKATVNLLPSRFAAAEGLEGEATFTLEDSRLDWYIDLEPQDGVMTSRGQLDLDDTWTMRAMDTQLDAVDLARFLSDHPTEVGTSVSARASGEASLQDWRAGRGAVTMQLDSVHWGGYALARADAEANWRGGRMNIVLDAAPTDTALVAIALTARDLGNTTRIESEHLSWRGLDVAALTGADLPGSDLEGSAQLWVDVDGSAVLRVNASITSAQSRWGVQQMSDVRLLVDATRARMEIEGSGEVSSILTRPEDSGEETASWQLESVLTNWQEERASVEGQVNLTGIDPMAFAGERDPGTALNGRARAVGTLRWGAPESASFQLDLGPSSLRGEPVALARLDGTLADSLVTANANLEVADGLFEGTVSLRPFDAIPSFRSSGTATRLNVLPLVGRQDLDSDVNLTWQVEGSSFDPGEADWRLSLEGQPSRLDSLVVEELSLEAGWDGSVLDVTNLTSRFNAGSAQINGRVNLDPKRSDVYSDLRATWYVSDLHVIERLLRRDRLASRAGTVDLQVFGPAGELDAEMLVSISDLVVDAWKLSSLEASSWVTLDEDMLPLSTEASIDIGYVALPTLSVRTTSLEVGQRGDVFTVMGAAMVDTGNRLSVAANINPFAERPWMTLRSTDLLLGGRMFTLERPASLVISDGWQLNRLSLVAPTQSISIAGGLDDSTGYALQVDLDAFDVAPVGQLAGYPELEGRLGASVLVSGPGDSPLIDSRIDLMLQQSGSELARVMADLQSTPQGLRVDSSVLTDGAENLTVEGLIPVFAGVGISDEERADREADLSLSIVSNGGSVRWLTPFLDPAVLADVDGRATANIEVSGSIEDPFLSGFLNLDDARFRLPEYGVSYRMDRFRSSLQGVTLSFEEATVRSGDGSMDVTGSIDFASLTNSSFDLEAQLNRFRAVRNEELHTTLSGALRLTGRTTRPDLTGELTTSNTSFWITETAGGDVLQVPLSFDDEVMLADNFGYRPVVADTLADAIWRGLSLDLSVALERDTWIRQRVNPEMAIELSGRVDVQKERGQDDLNLYRSIEVVPDRSTIKQFGRKFRIAEGVALFNGPIEEMVLQVEAEYEVPSRLNPGQPEVVITLRLDGRLDDLEFDLTSDPAMENTDIVSYIATGRPASESLQFAGSDFNNEVLVGVAASQLSGLVEGIAAQSLGLDVVDIEQDGLKGTRLTAGKYVTPRLFVGVTQPITFSGGSNMIVDEERELTLEYKVLEYLLLQLLADASDSPVRVNIAGRYSY